MVDKGSEFYNRSIKSWLEKKWHRNVCHSTTKMKPADVKLNTCIVSVFVIKKVKNTMPWIYVINKETVGTFYEKELQNTNQKEFKIEKVITRKEDKLYVKWKGYNNSLNSWINKKDIV